MKTLIAIPCMDTMPTDFTESLLNLNKPEGTAVCFKKNSLIYDARNLLSLTAIENGFDNVLWLDSDMIVPQDTILKLQMYGEMTTGLYYSRHAPYQPVIFDELDEPAREGNKIRKRVHQCETVPDKTLFPVKGCGFGCVLTPVYILKAVWDNFGPAFTPYAWGGEDVSFCHRVNELGYPIYCDPSVVCGHIGSITYGPELFRLLSGGDRN